MQLLYFPLTAGQTAAGLGDLRLASQLPCHVSQSLRKTQNLPFAVPFVAGAVLSGKHGLAVGWL
jgi:hypothetical protein